MIDIATMDFLSEAARNSGSEWLKDNRGRLAIARSNLIDFAAQLHSQFALVDRRVRDVNPDPRDCLAKAAVAKGSGKITFRATLDKNASASYFVQFHGSLRSAGAAHCYRRRGYPASYAKRSQARPENGEGS